MAAFTAKSGIVREVARQKGLGIKELVKEATLCFRCGEIILLGHEALRWTPLENGDHWLVAIHKECEWS